MKFWALNLLVLFLATGWVLDVFASEDRPLRIVSVNGALTEIIYELAGQDTLVGVDTTSQYPRAATTLPQVGYQRNLSIEGILSLKPTHILATADAGPAVVLQQLESSGIEIIQFAQEYSVDTVLDRVSVIAQLLNKKIEGDILINEIRQQFAGAQQLIDELQLSNRASLNQGVTNVRFITSGKKRLLFLLAVGSGSALASGSGTAADFMIELSGGKNVFNDFNGYKPVNAEAIVNAAPDTILVVSHKKEGENNIIRRVLEAPGVMLTPAGRNSDIRVLNGLRFLGFGPRIGEAVTDLGYYLYSDDKTKMVQHGR